MMIFHFFQDRKCDITIPFPSQPLSNYYGFLVFFLSCKVLLRIGQQKGRAWYFTTGRKGQQKGQAVSPQWSTRRRPVHHHTSRCFLNGGRDRFFCLYLSHLPQTQNPVKSWEPNHSTSLGTRKQHTRSLRKQQKLRIKTSSVFINKLSFSKY